MVKGDPARGGKGHVTGPCLDTNVSSMTTCTWKPSSVRAQEIIKKKQEEDKNRHYSPKQTDTQGREKSFTMYRKQFETKCLLT